MPGQLTNFTVFRTPPEELLVLVASLYGRGRAGQQQTISGGQGDII